jgi:hypothetical protein
MKTWRRSVAQGISGGKDQRGDREGFEDAAAKKEMDLGHLIDLWYGGRKAEGNPFGEQDRSQTPCSQK